jgi:hypothetical protein
MAGQVFSRNGFPDVATAMTSIVNDLIAGGFTQVYPTPGGTTFTPPSQSGSTFTKYSVSLDATTTVDPLAATQPWRLQFNIGSLQDVSLNIATPLQISSTGVVSQVLQGATATVVDYSGACGAQNPSLFADPADATTGFFNRSPRVQQTTPQGGTKGYYSSNSYPISYYLGCSPRGFALAIWEEGMDDLVATQSWVVVQRPVDRVTGTVLTTGKAPLFCVNSVGGLYWKFVVRETDINRPTTRATADANNPDNTAVINSHQQVAIDEAGKYIINFPCRLNTQRYAYTQEMDLLGYTSADVVSQFTAVPVTVYGETSARSYQSLFANGANDTNLRILFLTSGGGM